MQDDAGVDNRLVFLPHRLGGGEDEFLRIAVVHVVAAGEAAGPNRAHETFLDLGRSHRLFQIGDIGGDRRMSGIFDRRSADRASRAPRRRAPDQDAGRFRVLIKLAELLPVAAIAEGRQRNVGNARLSLLGFGNGIGRRKPAHAGKGVVPPHPIVVLRRHRLAEFAVIDDVDADLALLAHDVGDGGGKALCISRIVGAFAPARARLISIRSAGRDRLPEWVVKIRSCSVSRLRPPLRSRLLQP